MILRPRRQAELERHADLASLLASPRDGICYLSEPRPRRHAGYLFDHSSADYLIRLVGPILVPRSAIGWNLQALVRATRWLLRTGTDGLPDGLIPGKADLLVTADLHLLGDSFSRSRFVHPAVRHRHDGTWDLSVKGEIGRLAGRHLYLEMVPAHFGHLLVDMPGRLWPLIEPGCDWLADLPTVAFATHGLNPSEGIPPLAERLLTAIGTSPRRVSIVSGPTKIDELILPGRISPHRAPGGPRYNRLMAKAGRQIAGEQPGLGPRVFLSRSRLRAGRHAVSRGFQLQLDSLFARHGFAVVHPQEMDLADQIAVVRQASHLAGLAGSQMHLAAFSERPGLSVLCLHPDRHPPLTDRKIVAPLRGRVTEFPLQSRWLGPGRFRRSMGGQVLERLDAVIAAFCQVV